MNIYTHTIKTPQAQVIPLSEFKGKVLLIVNTATKCGLSPQFEGLEKLHQTYKEMGLVVIGFPSNQFLNQEPETNETIEEACKINFGVSFQLSEKINVNGTYANPLFKDLKKEFGGLLSRRIKWNFTKFLINRDGKPVKRYAPTIKPEKIEEDIIKLLNT
ncbi:MAG: glutathione peroxidase [Bacteroidetes bacterium]|nr:glutathione peroxidase [Bacteroidota bacterium]